MRMRPVILLIFVTYLTRVSAAPLAKRSNSTPFFGNYAQGYVQPNWIFGEGTRGGKLVGDRKRIKINGQPYEQWKVVPLSFVIEHRDELPKQKIQKRSYDDQLSYQKETPLPQGSTQFETEKSEGHTSTMVPNKRKLYVRGIKGTSIFNFQERQRNRIMDKLDPSRLDEQRTEEDHDETYTSVGDEHEDEVSTSAETVKHEENSSMYDEDEHIFGFISDESMNDDVDDVDDNKVRGILNRIKSPSKLKAYKSNWKPTKPTPKDKSPTLNNSEFTNKKSKLPTQKLVKPGGSRKQPSEELTPTGQTTKPPNSVNHGINNENGPNNPSKSDIKIPNNSEAKDELVDTDDKPTQRSLDSSNEIHLNPKNPSTSGIDKKKYGNPNDSIPIKSKKLPSSPSEDSKNNSFTSLKSPQSPDGNPNISGGDIQKISPDGESPENIWNTGESKPTNGGNHNDEPRENNRNDLIPEDQFDNSNQTDISENESDASDDESPPQFESGKVPKNTKAILKPFSKNKPKINKLGGKNRNAPIKTESNPVNSQKVLGNNPNINDGDTQKTSSNEESPENIWNTGVPKRSKDGITGINKPREGSRKNVLPEDQHNDTVETIQNENEPNIIEENSSQQTRSGENPQKNKTIKNPNSKNLSNYNKRLGGKNTDKPKNSKSIPVKSQQFTGGNPNINNGDIQKTFTNEESPEDIWNTGIQNWPTDGVNHPEQSREKNRESLLPEDEYGDSIDTDQNINEPVTSDDNGSPQLKLGENQQKNKTIKNPNSKNPRNYNKRLGGKNTGKPINSESIPVNSKQVSGSNPNINDGDIQISSPEEESPEDIWNTGVSKRPKHGTTSLNQPREGNRKNLLPGDQYNDLDQPNQKENEPDILDDNSSPQKISGENPPKNKTIKNPNSKNPRYYNKRLGGKNTEEPINSESIPVKSQPVTGSNPNINDGNIQKKSPNEESPEDNEDTGVPKFPKHGITGINKPREGSRKNVLPEYQHNDTVETIQNENEPNIIDENSSPQTRSGENPQKNKTIKNPNSKNLRNYNKRLGGKNTGKPINSESIPVNSKQVSGSNPNINDGDIQKSSPEEESPEDIWNTGVSKRPKHGTTSLNQPREGNRKNLLPGDKYNDLDQPNQNENEPDILDDNSSPQKISGENPPKNKTIKNPNSKNPRYYNKRLGGKNTEEPINSESIPVKSQPVTGSNPNINDGNIQKKSPNEESPEDIEDTGVPKFPKHGITSLNQPREGNRKYLLPGDQNNDLDQANQNENEPDINNSDIKKPLSGEESLENIWNTGELNPTINGGVRDYEPPDENSKNALPEDTNDGSVQNLQGINNPEDSDFTSSPQSTSGNIPPKNKTGRSPLSENPLYLGRKGGKNKGVTSNSETNPDKSQQFPDGNPNINDGDIQKPISSEESLESIWNTGESNPTINSDIRNDEPLDENSGNTLPDIINDDSVQTHQGNNNPEDSDLTISPQSNNGKIPQKNKTGRSPLSENPLYLGRKGGINKGVPSNSETNPDKSQQFPDGNPNINDGDIQKPISGEESLESIWNTGESNPTINSDIRNDEPLDENSGNTLPDINNDDSVQTHQGNNNPEDSDLTISPQSNNGKIPQKNKTGRSPLSENPLYLGRKGGKNKGVPSNSETNPDKSQQFPDGNPNINDGDIQKPISGEESLESIWNTGESNPTINSDIRNDEPLDENSGNTLPDINNDDSVQTHQGNNNPENSDLTISPQSNNGKIPQKNKTGRSPLSENPLYLGRKGGKNKGVPSNSETNPYKSQQFPDGNPNINDGDIQKPISGEESLESIWNTGESNPTLNGGVRYDEPLDENSRNVLLDNINDDSIQIHQGINNPEDSDLSSSPQSKSEKIPIKNKIVPNPFSKLPLYYRTQRETNTGVPINPETSPVTSQQIPGGNPNFNDGDTQNPFSGETSLESIGNTYVNKPSTNGSDQNDEPWDKNSNNALPKDNNSALTRQGMNNPEDSDFTSTPNSKLGKIPQNHKVSQKPFSKYSPKFKSQEKSPNDANNVSVDDGTVPSKVLLSPPHTSIPNEKYPMNPNNSNFRKPHNNRPIFSKTTPGKAHTLPGNDPIFNDEPKQPYKKKLTPSKSAPNTGSFDSENDTIPNKGTNPDMTPSTSILNNRIKKRPITSEVNPSKAQTIPDDTYPNVFGDIPTLESDEKNNDSIPLSEKSEPNMDKSTFSSIDSLDFKPEALSDNVKELPDHNNFTHIPTPSVLGNRKKMKPISSEDNSVKSKEVPETDSKNVFGDFPTLFSSEENSDAVEGSREPQTKWDTGKPQDDITDEKQNIKPEDENTNKSLEQDYDNTSKDNSNISDQQQPESNKIESEEPNLNKLSENSELDPDKSTSPTLGSLDSEPDGLNDSREPNVLRNQGKNNSISSEDKPEESITNPKEDSQNVFGDIPSLNSSEESLDDIWDTKKPPDDEQSKTPEDENTNISPEQDYDNTSKDNSNKLPENSELNPDESTSPTNGSLDSEPDTQNDSREPNTLSDSDKDKFISSEDKPEESKINSEEDTQNTFGDVPLLNSSEEVPDDIWSTKKPQDDITDDKQNITPQGENTNKSPEHEYDNPSKENSDISDQQQPESKEIEPKEPNSNKSPENSDLNLDDSTSPTNGSLDSEPDRQNDSREPNILSDSENDKPISSEDKPEESKLNSEGDSQNTFGDVPLLNSSEEVPEDIWDTKKPHDDKQNISPQDENTNKSPEHDYDNTSKDNSNISNQKQPESKEIEPEEPNSNKPPENSELNPEDSTSPTNDSLDSEPDRQNDSREPNILSDSENDKPRSSEDKPEESKINSEGDSQNTFGDVPLLNSSEEVPEDIWETKKPQDDKQNISPQDENTNKSPEHDYDNTSKDDSNISNQQQPESKEIEPEEPNSNKPPENSELNPEDSTSPTNDSLDSEPDKQNYSYEPNILSDTDKDKSISSEDKPEESKINSEGDSQNTFGDVPLLNSSEEVSDDILDTKKPQDDISDGKQNITPQDENTNKSPEHDYDNPLKDNLDISDQRQSESNETEPEEPNLNKPSENSKLNPDESTSPSIGLLDTEPDRINDSGEPTNLSNQENDKSISSEDKSDDSIINLGGDSQNTFGDILPSKSNEERPDDIWDTEKPQDDITDDTQNTKPQDENTTKSPEQDYNNTSNDNSNVSDQRQSESNEIESSGKKETPNTKTPIVQDNITSKDNSEISALDMSEPESNELKSDDELEPPNLHNIYKTSPEKNMDKSMFSNPEIGIPNVSAPSKSGRKKPTNSKLISANPQNIVGSMSNNKIGDISILNPNKKIPDGTTKISQNTINGSSSSDVPRKKTVNNYSSGHQSNIYKESNPEVYKNSPTNFINKPSSKRRPKTGSNKSNNDSAKIKTPSSEVSGGTPNPSDLNDFNVATIPVSGIQFTNNDQVIPNYFANKLQNKIPKESTNKLDTDPSNILNTGTSKPTERQDNSPMNANQNMQPSKANVPFMPDFSNIKGFNPYGYMIPKFNTNSEDENSNYNIWASSPPKQKKNPRLNGELGSSNDDDIETAKKSTSGSYHSNVISNQVNLDKNLNTKSETLKSDNEKSDNNKSNDKNGMYDEFIKSMADKVLNRIEDIDGKISKLEKNRSENKADSRDGVKTDDLKSSDSSSGRKKNTTKRKKEMSSIGSDSSLDESSSDTEKLNSSYSDESNDIKKTKKKTNKSKRNKNKKKNKSRTKKSNAAKKKNTKRQKSVKKRKKNNKDASERKVQSKDTIKRNKSRKIIVHSSEDDSSETDDSSSDKSTEDLKYKRKQTKNMSNKNTNNTNSTKKKLKRIKSSKNRRVEDNSGNETIAINNNRRDVENNSVKIIRNNDVNLMNQKNLGSNTNKIETEINVTEDNTEAGDGYKLVRFYPQYSYTNPLQRLFSIRRPPAYRGILS